MANNKNKANKAKVEKVESNNTKTDLIEKVMDEVKSVKEKSKNAYQKAIGSLIIVRH